MQVCMSVCIVIHAVSKTYIQCSGLFSQDNEPLVKVNTHKLAIVVCLIMLVKIKKCVSVEIVNFEIKKLKLQEP